MNADHERQTRLIPSKKETSQIHGREQANMVEDRVEETDAKTVSAGQEGAEARAEEYLKRLRYLQADFENYRRRVERERDETSRASLQKLISNLLSVMDELELAAQMAAKSDDREEVAKGIKVVLGKLYDTLSAEGLQAIESVGGSFDPTLHEAVEKVEVEDERVGKVVEEMRKGFMFDGKVLRPSAVKLGIRGVQDE